MIVTSPTGGQFKFVGLDDGTYYLREIKAPNGYNLPDADTKVEIIATTSNGHGWTDNNASNALTKLQLKVNDGNETDGNTGTGAVSTTVTNNKGTILPSTGGIGTTIFYILGSVLALGAVVLLVTKKRMGSER